MVMLQSGRDILDYRRTHRLRRRRSTCGGDAYNVIYVVLKRNAHGRSGSRYEICTKLERDDDDV